MKRVLVGVGKALRDTGQAVERMGMRAQDNWIFQEKICRHRALMNLFDQRPKLRPSVFVAPNASLIGNVSVMDESSIWYGAVVRGDQSPVDIGGKSSIGDRSVVLSASVNPTGFAAKTSIGDWVTVGQGCVLRGCTVDNFAVVGDGCVIGEGALVETHGMLEAGSVLPAGGLVPRGEVHGGNPAAFVRKLEKDEIAAIEKKAEDVSMSAKKHADEFLAYSNTYQLREQLGTAAGKI